MTVVDMTRKFISLFILVVHGLELFAFNLDIEEPQIYGGKGHTGEYFGYSVALDTWGVNNQNLPALVGAPLGNKTGNVFGQTVRYGTVYRCKSTTSLCYPLTIDSSAPDQAEYNGKNYDVELKTGQMLGATIVAKGNKFVVCAPGYTRIKLPTNEKQLDKERKRYMIGKCVYLQDAGNVQSPVLIPCIDRYTKSGTTKYEQCQAGFSAGLSSKASIVSMGLPGHIGTISIGFGGVSQQSYPLASTESLGLSLGDMMGYAMTTGFFKSKDKEEIISSSPRANNFKGKVAVYGLTPNDEIYIGSYYPKDSDRIQEGSYFGAALCAVDLNNDGLSDLLVGAPYHTVERDEGRVYTYMNNGKGALNLNKDMILNGDNKKNARFGFSIAAAGDLNYDGYQDVAIGAPYEDGVGAVYIYFGSSKGINLAKNARQKIHASKYGAMKTLGFSVSGGVDVDKNGYPDVLFGAVESDQAILLRTRPLVVVEGVVKLSTQQIVLETTDAMCQASDKSMHKCIDVTVCFKYRLKNPKQKKGEVQVNYSIDLDKNIPFRRLFIENVNGSVGEKQTSYTANFSLGTEPNKEKCDTKRTILLKQHKQIGDLVNPMTFDLTYSLSTPSSCAPDLCPLLDVLSGESYRAEARFLKHCKTQQVCKPDLDITANVTFFGGKSFYNKIFIGLVDTLYVNIDLKNNDEDAAYSSKVTIEFPPAISYIGPGQDQEVTCETKKIQGSSWQQAVCATGNPLRGKTQKKFYVQFSSTGVEGNITDFDIKVEAKSAADEKSYQKDANNKLTLKVEVTKEADLALEGFSEPDQVVYRRGYSGIIARIDQIGARVTQKLIVKNRGPSSVDGSIVNISVPVLYNTEDPKSFLLYLTAVEIQGGYCTVQTNTENLTRNGNTTGPNLGESKSAVKSRTKRDSGDKVMAVNCKTDQKRCLTFTCNIGQLNQGDSIVIEMLSRFWQSTLYKAGAGSVDLVTVATVYLPPGINEPPQGMKNSEKEIRMRANPETVTAKSKKLQWWIILLAVLGGILLLAGAVFLMYKKGFFKRKRVHETSSDADETVPMKNSGKGVTETSDA